MTTPRDIDPLQYYNLESYLFEDIGPRFRRTGKLDGVDLMSIVIWKANRAKSRMVARFLSRFGDRTLDEAAARIGRELRARESEEEELLRYLVEDWGLYLPMATSILSVLWPNRFTIYDVRVCDALGRFHSLKNKAKFEGIWQSYAEYRSAVREAGGQTLLRDCDRALWAVSALDDLARDIREWENNA